MCVSVCVCVCTKSFIEVRINTMSLVGYKFTASFVVSSISIGLDK